MDRYEVFERLNRLLSEVQDLSEALGGSVKINCWMEDDGKRISIADATTPPMLYSLSSFVEPHAVAWSPSGESNEWYHYNLKEVPYKGCFMKQIQENK